MITVGLADDQQLVRAGFAMVLGSQEDITVEWEASNGAEATDLAGSHPVDIILMDVQMPTMDGITATQKILDEQAPTGPAGQPTRVVVLTTFDSDNYVFGAVTSGASGFLLKDADPEELIKAVRTVGESTAVISPAATAKLMRRLRTEGNGDGRSGASVQKKTSETSDQAAEEKPGLDDDLGLPDPLTPRERQILCLIATGRSNQEIAEELFISLPTVKTHVGRILTKTASRDRVHAVLFALKQHLVSQEELLAQ
ncbi:MULTISPECIES: response regulator [Corynebacterium]|uniref:LuxR family transcriptional regulator n=1 Tax=Corynebacterium auriscanis TaxID=99807 RepID=A0A0A2DH42_9CORY|nr:MULTISPECIES: response regulator transcription factor [Corynebacterium]KGM18485.1 LuxR family transcriptional regulator [Corynebacterium auriscanis]MCX2162236.1 response regulator transcription factor [Corynebacterium auriscanis]OFT89965.1 DNA-binding response regulator [Corynebacterium sp. HMSC28B08]WJY73401.1 Transcriptional regulatory protein LiaR [Corynebacterium auriscanis]